MKYRIKERLDSLTHVEYKIAVKTLPAALQISPRTFFKYLYTRIDEGYSMPVDHLARLARFFNCKIEDLLNYEPAPISSRELKYIDDVKLIEKLKFVK